MRVEHLCITERVIFLNKIDAERVLSKQVQNMGYKQR